MAAVGPSSSITHSNSIGQPSGASAAKNHRSRPNRSTPSARSEGLPWTTPSTSGQNMPRSPIRCRKWSLISTRSLSAQSRIRAIALFPVTIHSIHDGMHDVHARSRQFQVKCCRTGYWARKDSNLRRQSHQIYSLTRLTTSVRARLTHSAPASPLRKPGRRVSCDPRDFSTNGLNSAVPDHRPDRRHRAHHLVRHRPGRRDRHRRGHPAAHPDHRPRGAADGRSRPSSSARP